MVAKVCVCVDFCATTGNLTRCTHHQQTTLCSARLSSTGDLARARELKVRSLK
jgi:hypothetical protein